MIRTGYRAAIAMPRATPTGATATLHLTPDTVTASEQDKRTFAIAKISSLKSMILMKTPTTGTARDSEAKISTRKNTGRDFCAVIRTRLIAENDKEPQQVSWDSHGHIAASSPANCAGWVSKLPPFAARAMTPKPASPPKRNPARLARTWHWSSPAA